MYTNFMDDKKEKDLDKKDTKFSKKLSSEAKSVRKEFRNNTITLLVSAFGLVAALSWNDFIKEFVNKAVTPLFGEDSGQLFSMLVSALIVTALAVIATYFLSKISGRELSDEK